MLDIQECVRLIGVRENMPEEDCRNCSTDDTVYFRECMESSPDP